jgi:molecular chaperone DnaK
MNKGDIEQAVKDAEKFAEEDKKRREEIDTRNAADQLVYQSEKTINDLGDKVSEDDKKAVKEKVELVKEALKGTDIDKIKSSQEELSKKIYEVSTKLYSQTGGQNQGGPQGGAGPDGGAGYDGGAGPDVHDAEYREVNDDDKK